MNKNLNPNSVMLWLAVTLAVLLIIILAVIPRAEPEEVADKAEPDLVRLLTVEPRDLVQTIALPGQVTANRNVMLAAELGGVITSMHVSKGEAVQEGDVLARIDHRNWEAQYRQAQVEARDAERDLARWEKMSAEGAVSQSEFDAVNRRQELAAIALELAQIQLDKSYIRAPANGVIDDKLLEAGAFVNEGQAIFRFLELAPMKVSFHIPEQDVGMIQTGQTLQVRAHALPRNDPMQARVSFVSQEAPAPTFSYPAELVLDDPPASLRPGMIVDVTIARAVLDNAIAVPLAAVIPRRGEHVVFLYKDGIAERTVVWINSMLNGEAVIESGLQPGDQIIVSGHRTLQDGTPVEVESDEE